jgi:hypothetical protein
MQVVDSPPVRAFPVSLSAEPHPIISTSPLVILLSLPLIYFCRNSNTHNNDDPRPQGAINDAYCASRCHESSAKPDCEVQSERSGKSFPLANSARESDFSTCISVLVIPYFHRRWLVELDEDIFPVKLSVASIHVVFQRICRLNLFYRRAGIFC